MGVEVDHGVTVSSIGAGGRVDTPRGSAKFDSVVIATGTRAQPARFAGSTKPGVHILASTTEYLELASSRAFDRVVVTGRGVQAFTVADLLRREGRTVTFLGRGNTGGICRALGDVLETKATEACIKVLSTPLQKAVGDPAIEAVVAGGRVIPCDALVVLPDRSPDAPNRVPREGPDGAVLVDPGMRTSMTGVFAAGSCAVMPMVDGQAGILLGGSAVASGRIAGANSASRRLSLRAVGAFTAEVFGLKVQGAGMSLEAARSAGMDALETVRTEGPSRACSLVHERSTGRLLGAQLVLDSKEGSLGPLELSISERLCLSSLAYSDLGDSTDISLLQDTARQGLEWS